MKAGHIPENLLDYEETPGASKVINKWVDEGHEVSVVTGRPFDSYEPSRRWLDEHHLDRILIYLSINMDEKRSNRIIPII